MQCAALDTAIVLFFSTEIFGINDFLLLGDGRSVELHRSETLCIFILQMGMPHSAFRGMICMTKRKTDIS